MSEHIPVLLEDIVTNLPNRHPLVIIDGTLGLGGHAKAMLEYAGTGSRLIAFEKDARNLALAKERLKPVEGLVEYHHDSYSAMQALPEGSADVVLLDLGFSSVHVDDASRGFSLQADGPLDMRYDTSQGPTAADIVNGAPREELAAIFRQYGEEPAADKFAKAITDARKKEKFRTTLQLAAFIESIQPRRGKVHPATRVFQALRIAVNDELGEVAKGITAAHHVLSPGGRLLLISFHSLEDRLTKTQPKALGFTPVNKKPIIATKDEITKNPRARSAKLRIYER